jgi:uncharacterized protein (DUF849 family)
MSRAGLSSYISIGRTTVLPDGGPARDNAKLVRAAIAMMKA